MEYLIVFFAMSISLPLIIVALTMAVAAFTAIAQCIRPRVSPTCRALFEQAAALERLGYQIADRASANSKNRAAFFAAIHALPHYAQLHAAPVPAVSDEEKQLRLLVLDMQICVRQMLGRLQARHETRIGRAERRRLRNEAAHLSSISKPLLLPLYERMHYLTAAKNFKK